MRSDWIYWGVGGLIVALSLVLGVQLFSLYGELKEKDRAIRLLAADLRLKSSPPVQAELSETESDLFSLRVKMRSKEKEIEELRYALSLREGDLEAARRGAEQTEEMIADFSGKVKDLENELAALLDEKKDLEKRLAAAGSSGADRLKEKEAEVANLQKENQALRESLERLKESVQVLEERNRRLAAPRLPAEAREKIKEFGNK